MTSAADFGGTKTVPGLFQETGNGSRQVEEVVYAGREQGAFEEIPTEFSSTQTGNQGQQTTSPATGMLAARSTLSAMFLMGSGPSPSIGSHIGVSTTAGRIALLRI